MKSVFIVATMLVLANFSVACNWVKTTPEGTKVSVAQAADVGGCVHKGAVTTSLKSRIAGFERKPAKVATELATLARNEAARMGGDTVVAESAVKDGRQEFGIYLCKP